MNKKQKRAIWNGIVLFVLIGLFPPWIYSTPVRKVQIPNPVPLEQRLQQRAEWRAENPNGIDFSDLMYPDTIEQHISARKERGFAFLFTPQWRRPLAVHCSLDIGRLMILWCMVAVITAGLFISNTKSHRTTKNNN